MAEGPCFLRRPPTVLIVGGQTHNALCLKKLAPLVAGDKRAANWVKRECQRELAPDSKGPFNVVW